MTSMFSPSSKAPPWPSSGGDAAHIRSKMKKLVCDATSSCNQRRISAIAHNVARASAQHVQLLDGDDVESERWRNLGDAALGALDFVAERPVKNIMASVDPPPRGVVWSRLRMNLHAPKEYEEEFFVPYLGERDEDQTTSSRLAKDLMSAPTMESPETSSEAQMKQQVLNVVKNSQLMLNQTHAVKNQGDDSDAENELVGKATPDLDDFVDGLWGRARKRVAIRNVAKAFPIALWPKLVPILAQMLGITSVSVYRYLSNAMYRENKWLLRDYETEEGKKHERQIVAQVRKTPKLPGDLLLKSNSVKYFLCRQCYTYDCQMHGDDTAKPRVLPYDRTRKENCRQERQKKISVSCRWKRANQCFFVNQFNGPNATSLDKNPEFGCLVDELRDHFGDDFCRITSGVNDIETSLYNVSCEDVGYYILNHGGKPSETGEEPDLRKNRNKKLMARETVPECTLLDYEPCNHEGQCTKENNCTCVAKDLACEKSCGCNLGRVCGDHVQGKSDMWCTRAFTGCNCSAAVSCGTEDCVCFAMRRECDPDLCRPCMHCEVNSLGKMTRKCRNSSLRLKQHHRVVVGRSRVHGWGVYSTGPIPEGDLIGEYVGEVIVHDHAERRGRVYDKVNYSFLFNLTLDMLVDSTRMGNKLRYCNHSFEPNCTPRLNRVSGDVRVGLYALRNIVPFEELFFNYNYDKNGPAWAQEGKRSKKTSRLAVSKSAPRLEINTPRNRASSASESLHDGTSVKSDGDDDENVTNAGNMSEDVNANGTSNRYLRSAEQVKGRGNKTGGGSANGGALTGAPSQDTENKMDVDSGSLHVDGISRDIEMGNIGPERGAMERSARRKRMRLLNGLGEPVGRTESSSESDVEPGDLKIEGNVGNDLEESRNRMSSRTVGRLDSDSDDI